MPGLDSTKIKPSVHIESLGDYYDITQLWQPISTRAGFITLSQQKTAWLDLHLIARTVNHQAGLFTLDSTKPGSNEFDKSVFETCFAFRIFIFACLSNST